jgi:hypothetical protein
MKTILWILAGLVTYAYVVIVIARIMAFNRMKRGE